MPADGHFPEVGLNYAPNFHWPLGGLGGPLLAVRKNGTVLDDSVIPIS